MVNEHTLRICTLNDHLRRTGAGGQLYITAGIKYLGAVAAADIIQEVMHYDTFTVDNDPYGEHDFGAFTYQGKRIFWKIDYYATDLEGGSPNPADPRETKRVLTILLADEY